MNVSGVNARIVEAVPVEKSASSFMAEPRVSDSLSARTGRGDYTATSMLSWQPFGATTTNAY